jgi:poly(3-hydroxybutyrate) depolymerase
VEPHRHNGGGDSLGIVSAVRWTISQFGADSSRVYATGISSGGMMTNVLIGAYPGIVPLYLLTTITDGGPITQTSSLPERR